MERDRKSRLEAKQYEETVERHIGGMERIGGEDQRWKNRAAEERAEKTFSRRTWTGKVLTQGTLDAEESHCSEGTFRKLVSRPLNIYTE